MMTASTIGERDAFGIDEANVTVSRRCNHAICFYFPELNLLITEWHRKYNLVWPTRA